MNPARSWHDLERRPGESDEDWGSRLVDDFTERRLHSVGERPETYRDRIPGLVTSPEVFLDLVVAEITLREEAKEPLDADEYLRRFPAFKGDLRLLFRTTEILVEPVIGAGPGPSVPGWYTGTASLPADFAGYRLLQELGGGGMARVFLAEPQTGGDQVVVKIPQLVAGHDSEAVRAKEVRRRRFLREGRLGQELDHPGLCQVLEVGESEGLPFLVMPYYPGGTLAAELARGGAIGEEAAVRRLLPVVCALQHAHDRGILHRDLKPSNLLVGEGGELVVTDFGLAVAPNAGESTLTRSGHIVGTVQYLSPEQARGESARPASDLFSLALVLCEMVSGKRLFEGTTLEVMAAIGSADPVPLPRTLSPDLAEILQRALAKSVARRYDSLSLFAEALQGWLDGTPPTRSWIDRPTRPRRWVSILCLLLLLILAGGLVWVLGPGPAPQITSAKGQERPSVSTRPVVGMRGYLQRMYDDLDRLDVVTRRQVRYLSLRAVHDNPRISDDDYSMHLEALQRVLNRLSLEKAKVPIYPTDATGCLLRIDLRDLGWLPDLEWKTIQDADPYRVRYDAVNPDESLRKLARDTYALAGVNSLFEVPDVRGDWLVAAMVSTTLFDRVRGLDPNTRSVPPFTLQDPDVPLVPGVQIIPA